MANPGDEDWDSRVSTPDLIVDTDTDDEVLQKHAEGEKLQVPPDISAELPKQGIS